MDTQQTNNSQNQTGSTLEHSSTCATVFQMMRFDRNCPRCTKIEKVIYLRRKTVANGASIEEQESASKLADKLVSQYGLVSAELVDRLYQEDVKAAEAAAKKAAAEERARKAAEAAEAAKAEAARKAAEAQARATEEARIASLKTAMDNAQDALNQARQAYQDAVKNARYAKPKTRNASSPKQSQTTCNGDADTCACRSHAAKRAWHTMRANGNGYAFGHKVAH